MKPISHKVPLIQQGLQDCVQASASQLLKFYSIEKSLDEIKKEVPVYVSSEGKPLGSSLGHIAKYFLKLGLKVTMHTADIEIFDLSWTALSNSKIVEKLKERRRYVRHSIYGEDEFNVIFDGYISFLENGGMVKIPMVTSRYIYDLLKNGPVYIAVSYQFLNSVSKYSYHKNTIGFKNDDIGGENATHTVVISGYKDGKFTIVDPDKVNGGIKEIDSDRLLGAFYLAQINFDNVLITVRQ